MRKPVILVSCDVDDGPPPACRVLLDYTDAVARAGGLPLVAPALDGAIDEALAAADGLLLTGGADYDPALYGEEPAAESRLVHPRRGAADLALARRALDGDLPILGICGGLQLLTIVLGGSLLQDIARQVPAALPHRAPPGAPPCRHLAAIRPESRLAALLGATAIDVNSYHHQAVGRPGRGLRLAAAAPDGVPEAFESADGSRFLLGVQWHPERDRNAPARALFAGFVEAARAHRRMP